MTGRDLIIYILKNNLENEPILKDGQFIGFITVEAAANILGIGTASVRALVARNVLKGITVNDIMYIYGESIEDYMQEK